MRYWNRRVRRHRESVSNILGTTACKHHKCRRNIPWSKQWQQNRRTSRGKLAFVRFLGNLVHFLPNQMQTDICSAGTCGFRIATSCNVLTQSEAGSSENSSPVLSLVWLLSRRLDVCATTTPTRLIFVTADAISVWGNVRTELTEPSTTRW